MDAVAEPERCPVCLGNTARERSIRGSRRRPRGTSPACRSPQPCPGWSTARRPRWSGRPSSTHRPRPSTRSSPGSRPARSRTSCRASSSGHPLHPVLVTVPIGAFTSAVVLDLTGRQQSAARTLVGLGLLSSVPTALAGLTDWSDTRGAERRVGTGAPRAQRRRARRHRRVLAGPAARPRHRPVRHARAVADPHRLRGRRRVGLARRAPRPTRWGSASTRPPSSGRPPSGPTPSRTPTSSTVSPSWSPSRTTSRSSSSGPEVASTRSPTGAPTVAARCTRGRSPTGVSNALGTQSRFALADGAVVQGPATRPGAGVRDPRRGRPGPGPPRRDPDAAAEPRRLTRASSTGARGLPGR